MSMLADFFIRSHNKSDLSFEEQVSSCKDVASYFINAFPIRGCIPLQTRKFLLFTILNAVGQKVKCFLKI